MSKNKKTKLNEVEQSTETVEANENEEKETKTTQPNVVVKNRRWLPYVITAVALAVFTVLIGWAQGGFTNIDTKTLVGNWGDAFFVPGIIGVCLGLLVLVSNEGGFDMLAYGFKTFFRLFKKDPLDRKSGGYYEYQQARRQKKRPFLYMIIVGSAYLLVGIVLLIIYSQIKQVPAPTA